MVAFGEEQETTRGFEVERLAAAGERADHHRTLRGESLLSSPQTLLTLGGADEDKAAGIEPKLQEPRWVWRSVLREHALLAGPNDARLS